ncbi:MAG: hypothetical protein WC476_01335 [Phycisphaerae bacterium]|jgi:dephospho-CoA kinase
MKNVAFAGLACSGKTTAANFFEEKINSKNCFRVKVADPIYEVAHQVFGMKNKDRKLLQQIGEKLREIDPNVFVNYILRYKSYSKFPIFIDDVRKKSEEITLRENGFITVLVLSDEKIRKDRSDAQGYAWHPEDSTEQEMKEYTETNYIITNNGSLTEFKQKLEELYSRIEERE